MKKTLVIGASENPERYSNRAINTLRKHAISVVAIGLKPGEVDGVKILTGFPKIDDVHTVTLYINAKRQPQYYEYILQLKPQRVIFNPGAENPEFEKKLREAGIEVVEGCTLIMLSIGNF